MAMSDTKATREPLVTTLEEAMLMLLEHDAMLVPFRDAAFSGRPVRWAVVNRERYAYGYGATWQEALSEVKMRSVVERDEAAQLRAAVKEWHEATKASHDWGETLDVPPDMQARFDRWNAASKALVAVAEKLT